MEMYVMVPFSLGSFVARAVAFSFDGWGVGLWCDRKMRSRIRTTDRVVFSIEAKSTILVVDVHG